jgi:hypothetical protein
MALFGRDLKDTVRRINDEVLNGGHSRGSTNCSPPTSAVRSRSEPSAVTMSGKACTSGGRPFRTWLS